MQMSERNLGPQPPAVCLDAFWESPCSDDPVNEFCALTLVIGVDLVGMIDDWFAKPSDDQL